MGSSLSCRRRESKDLCHSCTASSFSFSFESWTVGSQWIFLHEMELKIEKYWQTAMNMTGP